MNILIYIIQGCITLILANHIYKGYSILLILLIYIISTFLLYMVLKYDQSKF